MTTVRIGVVGDYRGDRETHVATGAALRHAAAAQGWEADVRWVATPTVEAGPEALAGFEGLLIAPGSPYRSMKGALNAITLARTQDVPLLGTCGGFQHVVIEFARNVAGIAGAGHAEYGPTASPLVVTELACSLAGRVMDVGLVAGSRAHAAYGTAAATERYYCNLGLNPDHVPALARAGLAITGTDQDGEPRVAELASLRFFVATLFVPQTSSAPGAPHPLIAAFVAAAVESGRRRACLTFHAGYDFPPNP